MLVVASCYEIGGSCVFLVCACPITCIIWSHDSSSESSDRVSDLWLAAGLHI